MTPAFQFLSLSLSSLILLVHLWTMKVASDDASRTREESLAICRDGILQIYHADEDKLTFKSERWTAEKPIKNQK